jgi:sodium/potassium-transporting ATPase subunit alpha
MPFNSTNKYALTIVEHATGDSIYCVCIKGAPEKVWSLCQKVLVEGRNKDINSEIEHQFQSVNESFANSGERVLGFAKIHLPKERFPQGFKFNVNSPDQFNFPLVGYSFLGLISLIDPPKDSVPFAVQKC